MNDSQLIRITVTSVVTLVRRFQARISENIATFLYLCCKPNWTAHELHISEACLCEHGKKCKNERAAANEMRRAYYKTEAGLETKMTYREKVNVKRQILNQLTMLNVSKM